MNKKKINKKNKNPIKCIGGLDKQVVAEVESLFALLEKQILRLSVSGQVEGRYREATGIDERKGVSM